MPAKALFVRNRFTWLAYLMTAYFAYLQAALGPLMPFLRAELGMSYIVGGLHFSAFALGMILAGLVSDRTTQIWGRSVNFWTGAVGMSLGALALAFSRQASLTIASTLLLGLLGSILQITIQAALSDQYQVQRTVALTEANIAASVGASLVPLLIGGFQQIGWGWRSALYLAAIALILISIKFRQSIPVVATPQVEGSALHQKLPRTFWIYWVVIFLGVSVEYCIFFWGADFLETAVGLTRSHAASTMSIFVLSGFVGRVMFSRLSRLVQDEILLLGAIAVTFFGFPMFWLANFAPINILGLLIAGLGVANFYPLILSLAVGAANLQSDLAVARLSIGVGMAILISPFILGSIADQIDLKVAFGFVIVMLVAMTVVSLMGTLSTGKLRE